VLRIVVAAEGHGASCWQMTQHFGAHLATIDMSAHWLCLKSFVRVDWCEMMMMSCTNQCERNRVKNQSLCMLIRIDAFLQLVSESEIKMKEVSELSVLWMSDLVVEMSKLWWWWWWWCFGQMMIGAENKLSAACLVGAADGDGKAQKCGTLLQAC